MIPKIHFCFLIFYFLFLTGCAPAIIGGAAAAGYVVVAQDFVTTSVDTSFQRAWNAANDEIRKLGSIEKSFQKLGEVKGTVQGAKVLVTVSKLTERTIDIKVTARKNLLPDTELAQAILAAILRKLR